MQDVRLPNGKVIKNVPEGTSKEEIKRKAIAAGLATESDFATQPQTQQPQTKQQPAELTRQQELRQRLTEAEQQGDTERVEKLQKSLSDIEGVQQLESQLGDFERLPEIGEAPELNQLSMPAFRASFGLLASGDDRAAQAVMQQQFPQATFEQADGYTVANLPSGRYILNKPGLSGQDIAQGLFNIAAFTPAGRAATVGGAVAKTALTEAALGEAEKTVGGERSTAGEIASAGALGGFFKGLENAVGAGYRAVRGKATGEGAEIVEAGRETGVPVMTTDVIPPRTFAGRMAQQTGEKIPFAGTGGRREAQQEAREQAVAEVADKYGEFSYGAIVDSLRKQSNRVKKAAGNTLQSVGNKMDEAGAIDLQNTRQAIDEAKQVLSKQGVIQSGGAVQDLQTLTQALDEASQTFTTLKENRTAFRDILQGLDKAERSQLGTRAKSVLGRVEQAMKKDMDAAAKANLSPKEYKSWQKANSIYFDEAQKLTKSRLKSVLDKGDITPENAGTVLFSRKPSEVQSLYDSLTATGRKNARAAIIGKIVGDLNKRASGVTPNSFASELNKYDSQIKAFFKGDERKQLEGLKKLLDATRRAQDASVTTPTGQSLIGLGTGYALFTDLMTTSALGGTAGGLARLYESPPVRNALLRLASVPKGSTKFEKALREAQSAIAASAQAMRREETETQEQNQE